MPYYERQYIYSLYREKLPALPLKSEIRQGHQFPLLFYSTAYNTQALTQWNKEIEIIQ